MSERPQLLTFFLTSSRPRAWLVVGAGQEQSQVVEMSRTDSDQWSASLWLVPGEYRCRYYCGDGHQIVYHGPASLNGLAAEGMDGLVSVESALDNAGSDLIHILLVEDNPASRAALAKLLQKDGYEVHAAEGYRSALAVAEGQHLDLAICDINLEDGDGADLLRELKALHPLEGIAVTGYTLPEETRHYSEAGFRQVLHKPIHYPELRSAIAALVALRHVRGPTAKGIPY